jgi:hypothetical protein
MARTAGIRARYEKRIVSKIPEILSVHLLFANGAALIHIGVTSAEYSPIVLP